ncbi:zinc-ribbon domain-containing protein [Paracoccus methylarcula]|nr:zinc-ribbon domain-containing protein [Paracoccus methylarcula]
MGEIRLGCPKCGTEYRLPEDAIPETGREVECTACGRVWLAVAPASEGSGESQKPAVVRHAPSATSPTTDDDKKHPPVPGDIPPLRRRLPDNVLNILREEVEYERRARQGELITQNSSDAPDPDWPATTVTDPEARPDIRDLPHSLPRSDLTTETPPEPGVTPPGTEPRDMATASEPAAPPMATMRNESAPPEKTGKGYFAGFGLAAGIAAFALALYAMAPGMAGNGEFGRQLMQYRQHVDAGRQWLQQQGSALIRRD